jgi:hypothetical protein
MGLLADIARYGDAEEVRLVQCIAAGRRLGAYRHGGRSTLSPASNTAGYVYYAVDSTEGFPSSRIKIGHSVRPVERLEGVKLKTRGKPALTVVAVEPGTWRLGRQRQREFAAWAVGSGWFKANSLLGARIDSLGGGGWQR